MSHIWQLEATKKECAICTAFYFYPDHPQLSRLNYTMSTKDWTSRSARRGRLAAYEYDIQARGQSRAVGDSGLCHLGQHI